MRGDRFSTLGMMAALALMGPALVAQGAWAAEDRAASTCASSGESAVPALARNWILVGWERKAGDPPFDFHQKLGPFYDWSSADVVLFDNFDAKLRITHSAAEYGAIWDAMFPTLRSVHHRLLEGPFVVNSESLAASTLQFAARIEGVDGKVTGIKTVSSLVWHCAEGRWQIVREHNSSVILPGGEIDGIVTPKSDN